MNDASKVGRHSISSILNHGQTSDDDRVDPSLVALTKQQQDRSQTDNAALRAEKRAQLEQEAERMREALRAKERELAELR